MEAFQRDSYLSRLDAKVVSCDPVEGGFEVRLSDTIAYAESGGQPADVARLNGVEIAELRKDHGIVHVVGHALEPGEDATVTIDWERRFDFMQQHSAQHLLTALAEDRWGWRTTSFHLGDDYSAVELDVSELTVREVDRLEQAANEAIRQARPIRDRWVSSSELEELAVRSGGLPDGHSGDVRLVEIEGVDLNTCGGTHVRSTAELQMIHLTGVESARGGTRLSYAAGGRVLGALHAWSDLQTRLSETLSVGPADYLERVEKMDADRRDAARDAEIAWDRWADAVGRVLASSQDDFIALDIEVPRLDLLAKVSQAFDPDCEKLFFGVAGEDEVVFLLSGPEEQVASLGPRVAAALDGRGGGRGTRFQGKGQRAGRPAALELFADE